MAKPTPFKRGDSIQVQIERLAVGGKGVARLQGLVVFIADVAPGEKVEAVVTTVKKNFAEASLKRLLSPAPERVAPPCPVAGVCGGCNWQHLSYSLQLSSKRSLVEESLRKFSGYEIPSETLVLPVIPSPKEFRYRNRIQLHYSGNRVGYHKRLSHEIVDIDDCPIADERLTAKIHGLRRTLAHRKAGRIELLLDQAGQVQSREPNEDESSIVESDSPAAGAFAQVNTEQNLNLVKFVLNAVDARIASNGKAVERVFDLYAGSGNFSLPLARKFPDLPITAVELNSASVSSGKEICAREGLPVQFVLASVDSFVAAHPLGENSLILLDPPRTGCGTDVATLIARQRTRNVIYVSCHPVTLARDLKPLREAGYKLEWVQPFDMFPQTDHVECVCFLTL